MKFASERASRMLCKHADNMEFIGLESPDDQSLSKLKYLNNQLKLCTINKEREAVETHLSIQIEEPIFSSSVPKNTPPVAPGTNSSASSLWKPKRYRETKSRLTLNLN